MSRIFNGYLMVVDQGDEARSSETSDFQNADFVVTFDGRLLKSRWTETSPDPIRSDFAQFLLRQAAWQMAFMASVIKCGSQLSEKEDAELTALQMQIREALKK